MPSIRMQWSWCCTRFWTRFAQWCWSWLGSWYRKRGNPNWGWYRQPTSAAHRVFASTETHMGAARNHSPQGAHAAGGVPDDCASLQSAVASTGDR